MFRAVVSSILALLAGCAGSCAQGAHAWRAAWGAPYPFEIVEQRVAAPPAAVRCAVGTARPFGVAGLSFQWALVRGRGGCWEAHLGNLRSGDYQEWHAGFGVRQTLTRGLVMMIGTRIFGVAVPNASLPVPVSASFFLEGAPESIGFLKVEGGIADLSLVHSAAAPEAVIVTRVLFDQGSRRLLLERSISPGEASETTFALSFPAGPLRLTQAYRCSVGEASASIGCCCGPIDFNLGERWHPQLGWTPRLALCWLRER